MPEDTDVGDCTVSSPTAAIKTVAAALPTDTDVTLAIGMFREDEAKALAEQVPEIDFVLTSKGLSFDNGRPLGRDQWLIGAGSRGKRLGVLTGTTTPGHKGWDNAKKGNALVGHKSDLKTTACVLAQALVEPCLLGEHPLTRAHAVFNQAFAF